MSVLLGFTGSDAKTSTEAANGNTGRARANVKLNAPAVSVVTFRWEHNSLASRR